MPLKDAFFGNPKMLCKCKSNVGEYGVRGLSPIAPDTERERERDGREKERFEKMKMIIEWPEKNRQR